MADFPVSPDQAQQLRDKGAIGQDTYDRIAKQNAAIYGDPSLAAPPVAPPPPTPPPASIGATGSWEEQAPAVDPMLAPPPPQDGMMNVAMDQANNAIAPYTQALEAQGLGVQKALDAAKRKGAEEAQALAGYQDEAMKIERNRAEIESMAQKRADDARIDMDKKIAEFSSKEVDTDRFYKNRSTGQKIAAAIGIALGGLGRGPNQALQVINDAVDRDIAEQRAEIGQKREGAMLARTAYQDFLQGAKDEKLATINMKMAAFENAKLKLSQAAAKYQGTQAALNADQAMAQIDLQKQALSNQRDQMLMRAAYTMPGSNAKPMDIISNVVPANFQNEAIKELGAATGFDQFKNELLKTYDRLNQIDVIKGSTPGILGGQSGSYEAENAKIAGAIIGKVPGIKSDADFKNVIVPMMPKPGDTPAEAKRKKAAFEGFLRQNAPSTPILTNYGIVPDSSPLKSAREN